MSAPCGCAATPRRRDAPSPPSSQMEAQVYEYFERIETLGGVIPAIEKGFFHREIAEAAFRYQREVEKKERIIVGVNEYVMDEALRIPLLQMDPEGERRQRARLERVRRERDNEAVGQRLEALRHAAKEEDNLMPLILEAVQAYATLGEVCGVLRQVFGEYQ